MGINASGAFNSPLSLWSSLYLDMNPIDLPEGLSPANEDMWFIPGSVQTRPALSRFLDTPLAGNPTIMSVADFPLPSGDFAAVFVDSLGNLSQKLASTGAVSQIGDFSPGIQFKAENAFDKQWYAGFCQELAEDFSASPFVGVDIPRYYDGQNLWRVTQDAPGSPPLVANNLISFTIAAVGVPGLSIASSSNGVSATESGHVVTLTYGSPFFVKPQIGDPLLVTGFTGGGTGYNGSFVVAFIDNHTIQYVNTVAGLAPAAGGTATVGSILVQTTATNTVQAGDTVVLAGAGNAAYDGTYTVRQRISGTNFVVPATAAQLSLPNSGGGTVNETGASGTITAGPHQCVLMFESFNGAITAASIPFSWVATGTNAALCSGILLGPPGTARRILAFTPTGGANFYYIPPSVIPSSTGGPALVTQGTIIDDNTTTSAVIDFSDQALTAGIQIDIDGNNLFNQIVLGPCLGVIEYQERMFWWGEINNIKNLNNMGFDGGSGAILGGIPPGWSNDSNTGGTGNLVLAGDPDLGFAYSMTSAGGSNDCAISQLCYQNYYGAPITFPNKTYIFRLLMNLSGAATGSLIAEFTAPSTGSIAKATINLAGMTTGITQWQNATFNAPLPAALPADLEVIFYLHNVTAGVTVIADELELIDADQPVSAQQMRASYAGNPFGYDVNSGKIGIDSTDAITAAFKQRGYLYPLSNNSQFLTQNNGSTEPDEWQVTQYAQVCGCSGPCAVDSGEGVAIWAGRYGRFLFAGDTPKKISQEIQPIWDRINWNAETRIWLVNDPVQRVIYTGLPLDQFTAPSVVQPVSYRSVDTAYNVPDPLHTSYSGKLIATDLCRKSTIWNTKLNCGAMVTQPLLSLEGTAKQMIFGGGNGLSPGNTTSFGELYLLDFAKYTDDDYGRIGLGTGNYYITYAWWNHDMEQNAPGLGLHRKIYTFLSAYLTGVGDALITIYVDSLSNPVATLRRYGMIFENLKHDLEWGLNVTGDRVFFKVQPMPLRTAIITNISIVDNILTVRANIALGPTQYSLGQQYTLAGLTTATFLNGQRVTITKVSAKDFQSVFVHADYLSTPDTGSVQPPSTTDAYMNINHLVVSGRMDKVFPVRGAYL